ncbi:DNA replication regulator SLD2 [Cercospora zeina]
MSIKEEANQVDTTALRAELKTWENAFKEKHGRKAGREDIKKDTSISAKYKLYNELTRLPKLPSFASTPRKSTRPTAPKVSPAKPQTRAPAATPRKTPIRLESPRDQPQNVLSPVKELEPEPTPQWVRAGLGPTPQRDGHVLGLFDIEDDIHETPLKARHDGKAADLVAATPSKGTSSAEHVHMKSPESSNGKRFMLAAFAGTPLKRKRENHDIGTTSSSKRMFATPSFLRRCNPLAKIDEDEDAHMPVSRPPFQKRGLVRSLSTIIQNLKKQQEKDMEEEWDIMDEIEAELRGETIPKQKEKKKEKPKLQVEDSQATEMPLGPDQAPESSDEDSARENNEPTRKPWKKKGLKRQTRRTNMKPVLHKPRKEGDVDPDPSDDEERTVISETQPQGHDEDDFEDVEKATEIDRPAQKSKSTKSNISTKGKREAPKETDKDDSKKKPRKVNPESHANYRRLNIKNKNSKAKGRGRFGRR